MAYAVILSGGTGSRLGLEIPKQYYEVGGKPIIQYVLETIGSMKLIAGFVIVAAEEWHPFLDKVIGNYSKFLGFAQPGANRQLSVYHGLESLRSFADENDIVLIQDAARPNTSEELLERCIQIPEGFDGTMPVLAMKDTIYLSTDGKQINSLLQREQLFAGQAPEAFRFGKYIKANERLLPEKIRKISGSSEPAVLDGMKIAMISGDEANYKITTNADLERFRSLKCR